MAELSDSDLEPSYAEPRVGDVKDSLACLEKARAVLGYEPVVGWEQGLEGTVAWYAERFRLEGVRP